LTGGADALKSLAVVVSGSRAVSGEGVASIGQRAQSSIRSEGQTVSAAVVGSATRGNSNTCLSSNTPAEVGGADALKSLTVVVSGSRAVSGEGVASIGQRTQSSIRSESEAVSTVVVGSATRGNSNTSSASGTPGLSIRASTFAGRTVMVGGVRAVSRESVTSSSNGAESSIRLESQTRSAIVPSSTA
jgi:hypothetical protein